MKNYLMHAIESLAPNSEYVIFGDEYSGIEWRDTVNTKPTEEQVTAKIAEIKAAEPMTLLRDERNILLAQTDFTQLGDIGLSDSKKAEWVSYRKALRDLPSVSNPKLNSFGDLDMSSVSWPSKPS
tara:strand:+ start:1241 stop:1615 length:375 start_codon:yes stop_codon:yes gene_type:complete